MGPLDRRTLWGPVWEGRAPAQDEHNYCSAGCYVDSVRGEAFHGRTSISPARWCQLVELARELERHLIVVVAHRRCGIGTQVEDFIKLQNNGDRVLHFLGRHDFVVDSEYPRAAATDDKVFLFLVRQARGSAA